MYIQKCDPLTKSAVSPANWHGWSRPTRTRFPWTWNNVLAREIVFSTVDYPFEELRIRWRTPDIRTMSVLAVIAPFPAPSATPIPLAAAVSFIANPHPAINNKNETRWPVGTTGRNASGREMLFHLFGLS